MSVSTIDALKKKWAPLLENAELGTIRDAHRKGVTAQMLENQYNANRKQGEAMGELFESTQPFNTSADFGGVGGAGSSNIKAYDPILISLVRRTMPNMIAYDVCGVQPMTGPTGLIFAMRPKYVNRDSMTGAKTFGNESFYNEVDTDFSGDQSDGDVHAGNNPSVLNLPTPGTYTTGRPMSTLTGETLGADELVTTTPFKEMGFSIEKVPVTAKTRALKAEYSVELAQDLKQLHGIDAETELANILSAEILAEINREIIRTIYIIAKKGAVNTTTPGNFDLANDSNGRWFAEKIKGMMYQIEREANAIARETRRGRGNVILCSSDVASALAMLGVIDTAPALQSNRLEVDDTGNTFVGVLNGRYKVFIDPYAVTASNDDNFFVVGYKGVTSAFDAGLFYCPYVPLQMYRAVGENNFQPKIAFKSRYGLVANPYAEGATAGLGALTANANVFYRKVRVTSLSGMATV